MHKKPKAADGTLTQMHLRIEKDRKNKGRRERIDVINYGKRMNDGRIN